MLFRELDENTIFIALIAGVFILIATLLFLREGKYHGPWGLPYFGIFFALGEDVGLQLMEMARKKYGDVFLFKITGQLYVHLASVEANREVHIKKAEYFPYRVRNSCMFQLGLGQGLILENGERWKIRRKFFIQVLREFTSKEALAGRIDVAVNEALDKLRVSKGKPISFLTVLHHPFVEAVRTVFVSDSNKHLVYDVIDPYMRIVTYMKGRKFLLAGSLARWFSLRFTDFKEMNAAREEMEEALYRIVRKRESEMATGDKEDTLIDRYLQERNSRLEKGDPQAEFFDADSLVQSLILIFGDMCCGITPFVASLLSDLALKPEVQERMRNEMLRELGPDLELNPSLEDKVRLPYINAVLKELIRCTPFFPFFPSIESVRDTSICGVHVPAGTVAVVNNYAVNHDPKVYDEPDVFKPERFLSSKAQALEQPIISGTGKRTCIGEALTSMVLFLYFTAIVRNFILRPAQDVTKLRLSAHAIDIEICASPVNS